MGWGLGNVNVVTSEALRYPANRGTHRRNDFFRNDPVADTVILLCTQNSPADPDNVRQKFKTAIQGVMK